MEILGRFYFKFPSFRFLGKINWKKKLIDEKPEKQKMKEGKKIRVDIGL